MTSSTLWLVSIFIFFFDFSCLAADSHYLGYDEFIANVRSGSVKSVSLDRFSQISGTYIADGTERPFTSYGDTGSANDVLLIQLLKDKNVATTLKPQKERSFFSDGAFAGILMLAVPLITLVVALRINSKINRMSNEPKA